MFRTTSRSAAVFPILFVLIAIASNVAVAQIDSTFTDASGSPRRKVIMSMVLDRSGSMTSDGGAVAIQSAVPTFISLFNNLFDDVALLSFSSNARIDVPIGHNFIAPIDNAVASMEFIGGTFGTGAGNQPILSPTVGAPMSLADLQNNSVVVPPGQKVSKVMVYFTDGLMNAVQDNFHCGGRNNNNLTLINYGGYDSGTEVGFFDPTCSPNSSNGCTNESGHESQWGTCTDGCPNGFPYDPNGDVCKNSQGQPVTTFLSQQTGQQTAFSRAHVTVESQYRAIYTANAMRTESPVPTYIYTIGLGNSVSPSTQAFLAQLANDPRYPTYISSQPAGEFFYIPNCPSPTCTAELTAAFEAIASKLLPR